MKIRNVFTTMAVLLVVLMSSCDQNNDTTPPSGTAQVANSVALTSKVSAVGKSVNGKTKSGSLAAVNLGIAGNFAILSKSGITDVYKSAITGDIGSSPITGAAVLVRCNEVVGTIYTVDAAGPLPCSITNATRLTTAVGDMQTAYTDAAGRSNPDFLNLGAGNIGGKILTAGLYKWTTALNIPTDITISGSSTDVWIFQVAGTLKMSSAVRITLAGRAQAKNIFWVVSDAVTCGTTSHFEGNILGMSGINLQTGATINGRMLAQTAVTLQMNTVTQPQ
ncbi:MULTISPECIES: ice-binding protein [unclassified Flavobacterium]|uniref:ice-binding protein n=3 Tax=Flavobacterium TaxID=237 RepID=UPI0025BC0062|nr:MULTISPECIES: ice-binding protein [unclassified Flavobacterium]